MSNFEIDMTAVNFGFSNKLCDYEETDENILFEMFGHNSDNFFDFLEQWEDEKLQMEIVDYYCNVTG